MALLVNKDELEGLRTIREHGLVVFPPPAENVDGKYNEEDNEDDGTCSFWCSNGKVDFDVDGRVALLDLGGKRLHRGVPCPGAFERFSRMKALNSENEASKRHDGQTV